MSYQTFDFPFHGVRHEYPEGDSVRFGRGYDFGIEPILPLQRTFVLSFEAMKIIRVNGSLSTTEDAQKNLLALDAFYAAHRTDKRFNYQHELFGTLVVRFKQAFQMPSMRPGGLGVSESFELQLIEAPE